MVRCEMRDGSSSMPFRLCPEPRSGPLSRSPFRPPTRGRAGREGTSVLNQPGTGDTDRSQEQHGRQCAARLRATQRDRRDRERRRERARGRAPPAGDILNLFKFDSGFRESRFVMIVPRASWLRTGSGRRQGGCIQSWGLGAETGPVLIRGSVLRLPSV
eukprot:3245071-Prymnesium_polylepis.2